MTIDVNALFPRFILKDKNGYALAQAIKAALVYAEQKTAQGIATVLDVDSMPQWRLDEMAKELNCLYDYTASVAKKRYWIKNAVPLYAAYGTPKAILNYLEGMFDSVSVEETSGYNFSVTVYGAISADNVAWLQKAVAATKNVRSVFTGYNVGALGRLYVTGSGEVVAQSVSPRAGTLAAGDFEEL